GARPRPVVLGERLAVRQWDRDDRAIEEAVVASFDRGLLALHRETVLLRAADLLATGNVLRRLAHRDVDVGVFLCVAGHEPGVIGIRRVRISAPIAGHAFDADGEEYV